LARALEESGFESVWTAEHILWPDGYESEYPYADGGRMPGDGDTDLPDPFIWLCWVAAHSSRLKLATGIAIVPQRHPALMAKEVATLDVLSGGRAILGIGVGWLEEEFAALNVPWARRGARTDEYIDVMRRLWSERSVDHKGEFVTFAGMNSNPKPVRRAVPIVVGGHSVAAARRAGRLGDGFVPLGGDIPQLIEVMRATATDAGRDPGAIEITATHDGLKRGDPAEALEEIAGWGVDRVLIPAHRFARGDVGERCREWALRLGIGTTAEPPKGPADQGDVA
jgi:probable F420-dependent oxidoreductase